MSRAGERAAQLEKAQETREGHTFSLIMSIMASVHAVFQRARLGRVVPHVARVGAAATVVSVVQRVRSRAVGRRQLLTFIARENGSRISTGIRPILLILDCRAQIYVQEFCLYSIKDT